MANSGPNTNGSQFFIVHQDAGLPNAYTIFGQVTEGMDVVDALAAAPSGPQDRPHDPVAINSVTITEG
jgi:cyclophilin family peptidyl-prolyl cis-trans isomerase